MTSSAVSTCLLISSVSSLFPDFPHFSVSFVGLHEEAHEGSWNWRNGRAEISFASFQQLPATLGLVSGAYGHEAVVVGSLNDSQVAPILSEVSVLLRNRRRWSPMVFLSLPPSSNLLQSLPTGNDDADFQLPLDSDVYFLQSSNFTEIYAFKGSVFLQAVPPEPTTFYRFTKKNDRRADFHRLRITAVSMDVHGYELATDFDDDNSTGTKFIGGFEVQQFWYLRDALNFTEGALKGTNFIREGPNKTLTGMAVPVNKGDADVGISGTEFIEYRISGPDGITYLQPTISLEMTAFFKQPPASSIRDVFTSAFSFLLWVCLLLLWIALCVALSVAYFLHNFFSLSLHPQDEDLSSQIYLWAAGASCQQGFFITPVGISARIIFFSGWFFGLLCYTAFAAQLVSILAVEVIPVKSFDDLLRSDFFIFNDGHIPTTKFYVQGLQDARRIPSLPESRRNVEIDATIGNLVGSRAAMISVTDSFYPILQKEGYAEKVICEVLSEVRVGARPIKMSMFVKRGSQLRDIFNTKILGMCERGVRHRLMRSYLQDTSVQCLQGGSGVTTPIASKDLFTAYGLLSGGVSLAFCILLAEKMVSKLGSRSRSSSDTSSSNAVEEFNVLGMTSTTLDFDVKSFMEKAGRSNNGRM